MTSRFLRNLLFPITLLVFLYSGFYLAREYTKVDTLINMRDMWSWIRFDWPDRGVFYEVDPEDFVGSPIPAAGDTLLEIDGMPASGENYFRVFNPGTPVGEVVAITYTDGEERMETRVVTRAMAAALRYQVVSLFVLRSLITAALLFVGFYAFMRRRDSSAVHVLALFCYSMAINMLLNRVVGSDKYATLSIPYGETLRDLFQGFAFFAPVFWLKLQFVFPRRNRWHDSHPVLANLLLFLPGLVVGVFYLAWRIPLAVPTAIHMSVYLGAGCLLLVRNHRRAEDFLARRQTKLVLIGSLPGILLYGVFPWLVLLGSNWVETRSMLHRLYAANATFLFVLLIPLVFAYALGRYRLLEVEARLRKGTLLVGANALVLLAFFGFLYAFGEFVLEGMRIRSRTPTLAVALLLAIGFTPAQRWVRGRLERRLFPERERLRIFLREFLHSAEPSRGAADFWSALREKLALGLETTEIHPLLVRRREERMVLPSGEEAPFRLDDPLLAGVHAGGYPLLVDEAKASEKVSLSAMQIRWLEERSAAVLLPLSAPSGLLGLLVLGEKREGEDYAPEELDLLRSLSAQIAFAVENIGLLEEKIEKEKLKEQLSVARKIQEGLLPKRIPETPGIRVASRIRFCLDVAGDYYDVVDLGDGRALIAVGDVAGKGVGAALLMANLQASLRAARESAISPADLVARINRLVYENTPADLFITLFIGVFDPVGQTITYVNGGHNPPLLRRADGRILSLEKGGLLLGVDPLAEYEEERIDVGAGDVLLLYTDGVSEAMNGAEEDFGERRLADVLSSANGEHPEALLGRVEEEVDRHTGGAPLEDDYTLVAVSVL